LGFQRFVASRQRQRKRNVHQRMLLAVGHGQANRSLRTRDGQHEACHMEGDEIGRDSSLAPAFGLKRDTGLRNLPARAFPTQP